MKNAYMTFNLKYDFISEGNNSWNLRSDRIAKIIKENNPICIGTQEGLEHMLRSLEGKLLNYEYIGEGREGEEKGEYNAIFYNKNILELIEWDQFWISETPNVSGSKSWNSSCVRICTFAKFKNKLSNEKIMFYNTHLDHESKIARKEGLNLILKICKKNYFKYKIPFIITGDFNCTMNDVEFKTINNYCDKDFIVNNAYNFVNHNIIGTFHDFNENFNEGIIDYILYSNDFYCENIYADKRKIDGGYPSDHFPVVAILSM